MLTPSRKAPTLLTKVVIVQVIVILAMDKSWCFANQPSLYEYKLNPPPPLIGTYMELMVGMVRRVLRAVNILLLRNR
jgi:hypothetical protein